MDPVGKYIVKLGRSKHSDWPHPSCRIKKFKVVQILNFIFERSILVTTFSPFSTIISKGFFLRVNKPQNYVVSLQDDKILDWSKFKALPDDQCIH